MAKQVPNSNRVAGAAARAGAGPARRCGTRHRVAAVEQAWPPCWLSPHIACNWRQSFVATKRGVFSKVSDADGKSAPRPEADSEQPRSAESSARSSKFRAFALERHRAHRRSSAPVIALSPTMPLGCRQRSSETPSREHRPAKRRRLRRQVPVARKKMKASTTRSAFSMIPGASGSNFPANGGLECCIGAL